MFAINSTNINEHTPTLNNNEWNLKCSLDVHYIILIHVTYVHVLYRCYTCIIQVLYMYYTGAIHVHVN